VSFRQLPAALYRTLLVLWVGGMWVVGYLVVPALFATTPDRALAGRLAGRIFELHGGVGLVCGALMLVLLFWQQRQQVWRSRSFWLVIAIAVPVALSQFGIQPWMADMKAQALPLDVMDSPLRDRFVFWHGVSSLLYLMQSGLGLWLVAGGGQEMEAAVA
jgi:hypothetical protein